MRIRELLEGKKFNDLDWITQESENPELNYDLSEDLMYFMNNDDEVYRRVVYPSVAKCTDRLESNQKTSPSMFKHAVQECYKEYIKQFPIKQLPDSIEEKICTEVCNKIHETVCADHSKD